MTSKAVRCFEKRDIPFALAQTEREGWDSTAESFEIHLAHDPEGCFLATVGDIPAGIVAATRFRDTGWIGELIVDPDYRGRGMGTLLMEHAVGFLEASGLGTLRLEADPAGIPIYEKLGFVHEFESPRFRLEKVPDLSVPAWSVHSGLDLDEAVAFDAPLFGDDRRKLLGELFKRARAVYRSPNPLSGYLVVQPSRAGARLGPWLATDPEGAAVLLRTALAELRGESVIAALPGVNRGGQGLLERFGFVRTPSSFRMVRGPKHVGGKPENVYAIAGGAYG
jgi:GNAT superfamily N-acetyltransferase